MTRLLLAVLAGTLLLSGCSGAEGARARELLLDSQQAVQGARSLAYEADVTVDAEGRRFTARIVGAARMRDREAVDQHLRMTAGGTGGQGLDAELLVRDGRAWMRLGGAWQSIGSVRPSGDAAALQELGPELLGRLAPFIEDVSVDEDATVGGKAATVVSCRIDTAGVFGEVVQAASATDFPGFDDALDQVRDAVDDMRATLVFDPATQMLTAARVTVGLHLQGRSASLELQLRVTGVNGAVRIPEPPAG